MISYMVLSHLCLPNLISRDRYWRFWVLKWCTQYFVLSIIWFISSFCKILYSKNGTSFLHNLNDRNAYIKWPWFVFRNNDSISYTSLWHSGFYRSAGSLCFLIFQCKIVFLFGLTHVLVCNIFLKCLWIFVFYEKWSVLYLFLMFSAFILK